jgi:glycosyltransferase involved in cell wall biosynthesis
MPEKTKNTLPPRVSTVIPCYNGAAFAAQAVESALAQNFKDMEIIVVDDGSTDDSAKVLSPYVETNKINYIHQANAGLSAARNTGIARARGEFIALLDADDLWRRDKIELQVQAMDARSDVPPALVFTDYDTSDGLKILDTGVNSAKFEDGAAVSFEKLFSGINFIYPSTALIRKSAFDAVGAFDASLCATEDYDMWLRIARRFPVTGINRPLAIIRLHAGNMSKDITRMVNNELKVVKKNEHLVGGRGLYLKRRAKVFYLNADRCVYGRNYSGALRYFAKGVFTFPSPLDMSIVAARFIIGAGRTEGLRKRVRASRFFGRLYNYFYGKT